MPKCQAENILRFINAFSPSLALRMEKSKTPWGQDGAISEQSELSMYPSGHPVNPAMQLSEHPQGNLIIWLVPYTLLVKITRGKLCFSSNLTGNFPSLQRDLGSDGSPCREQGFKNKACDIKLCVLARLYMCLLFYLVFYNWKWKSVFLHCCTPWHGNYITLRTVELKGPFGPSSYTQTSSKLENQRQIRLSY